MVAKSYFCRQNLSQISFEIVANCSHPSEILALRAHLTLTLWVQCIVHLRSTFKFLPSKLTRRYVVLYALVHYEKAVFIECFAVYIVTEPTVN